jgi:hypothetical protein
MEAFDKVGNSYYRYRGPYSIVGLRITGVTIEGYWNHWRGQIETWGDPNPAVTYPRIMSVEPHRFLSIECLKININTSGYADKVEIRFSPELEAMQFTDLHGFVYDYYLDYDLPYVYFPVSCNLNPSVKDNHVYWEYILPLAHSTVGWNDVRKGYQYYMAVTAWKGTKSVTYTIDDIDITGNIYNLIYIQPVK